MKNMEEEKEELKIESSPFLTNWTSNFSLCSKFLSSTSILIFLQAVASKVWQRFLKAWISVSKSCIRLPWLFNIPSFKLSLAFNEASSRPQSKAEGFESAESKLASKDSSLKKKLFGYIL